MSTTPFEIKVVYDATSRKRRGAVVRSSRIRAGRAPNFLVLGGLLNLVIAGALYLVTWWQADPFIYLTFMKRMPIEVSREFATNPFGLNAATFEQTTGGQADQVPVDQADVGQPSRWNTETSQAVVGTTAYGWLTLATAAVCAVAMAGGAWASVGAAAWLRILGWVLAIGLVVALAYAGWDVWRRYQAHYPVRHLRIGMGLLGLLFAFVGLALGPRARGITKLAGLITILAVLGTLAGAWLWKEAGALNFDEIAWKSPSFALALNLAALPVTLVWGVVLLFSAQRIRV